VTQMSTSMDMLPGVPCGNASSFRKVGSPKGSDYVCDQPVESDAAGSTAVNNDCV
jgi:hypothetical protein